MLYAIIKIFQFLFKLRKNSSFYLSFKYMIDCDKWKTLNEITEQSIKTLKMKKFKCN